MERSQKPKIINDLAKKMVFLVGPRQVGKTWLAKDIGRSFSNPTYLNYDSFGDRKIIKNEAWLKSTDLLILDEIHKMRGWKSYLKGVFDTMSTQMRILVTGSARLDFLRRSGDSLAGRFFVHRLMPFSPAELSTTVYGNDIDRFMTRGGFPEPFLTAEATDADRWRQQYVDGLIRTDVLDFERVYDLRALQVILELLRTKVGTPVSYKSLAQDAEISPNTAKKYVQILEALYIVFRVTPYSKNVARSLLKNPKIYFYDTGMVRGDPGAVFENFAAICLLKHVLTQTDAEGREHRLHMIRTKEGKEVDFCLAVDDRPEMLIEIKLADAQLSPHLAAFSHNLGVPGVQVVKELKRERREGEIQIRMPESFFKDLLA